MSEVINVVDLHTCIQGEGQFSGIPHILIRVSGCNLRCQFKDNICDTPYSSWFPEKGEYTLVDVENIFKNNPQIKHTFITGGEPFLDPQNTAILIDIAKKYNHFVAAETNGSLFAELKFDFVTISPKLNNSVPVEGTIIKNTEGGDVIVSKKEVERHEKQRKRLKNLEKLILSYKYQMKYVVEKESDIQEIIEIQNKYNIPAEKIYLMPEGIKREQLNTKRVWVIEKCIELGFNYSDRLHIIAYGEKRDA